MRILGIDHIGIASADLGKHIEIFGDKLGLEIHDFEEKDPYGGLRTAFARVGDTDFEILEDRVPDGEQKVIDQRDIATFVPRRGAPPACIAPPCGSPTSKRPCGTPGRRGFTSSTSSLGRARADRRSPSSARSPREASSSTSWSGPIMSRPLRRARLIAEGESSAAGWPAPPVTTG